MLNSIVYNSRTKHDHASVHAYTYTPYTSACLSIHPLYVCMYMYVYVCIYWKSIIILGMWDIRKKRRMGYAEGQKSHH